MRKPNVLDRHLNGLLLANTMVVASLLVLIWYG
jgi:hypothetical protein